MKMKKNLYIIPGWEETCRRRPYRDLANAAAKKGYEIIFHHVDWKKPLSPQVFSVHRDGVLFGFSLGAILAWLIAQRHPCRHLILASMTPHESFQDPGIAKALRELTGSQFVTDIKRHLKRKNAAKKQTILYGEAEEEPGDILVPDTGHVLSAAYINKIAQIL